MIVAAWRNATAENRRELEVRDSDGTVDTLWYEFDGDRAAPVPESLDAAVVALLPYAMHRGEDLHLEGSVDGALLANLASWQDTWARWRPDLFRRIRTSADEVADVSASAAPTPRSGAVAFSGGVDSCYTVAANTRGLLGERTVPIRVAIMVQGLEIPLDDDGWFSAARSGARQILADFEIPLMCVRTNWHDAFCPHWAMTFMNGLASVLHLFSDRAEVGLVASESSYALEVLPWGSNSITNPLLGGARFPIWTVGLEVARTDRCRLVGEWASIRDNVRVCYAGPRRGINCGSCSKCVQTKLNFVAAGVGAIPALGPVTARQVRTMKYNGVLRLRFMKEIASHRDELPQSLRRSLRIAIARHSLQSLVWTLRRKLRLRARLDAWRHRAPSTAMPSPPAPERGP